MRYFVIGNSYVPRDMTVEQAWISLRIAHNDIQTAFLHYDDAVKVARAEQAHSNKLCPIIQIEVTKTAEEPISSRFFIEGQAVKDKNRAVYLTMQIRGTDKVTEFKIIDATFDYKDNYTPTSTFNYSELDFKKIAAERDRIGKEQFNESIGRSEAEAKARRQKAKEDSAKEIDAILERRKPNYELIKGISNEQTLKQQAEEQPPEQKADEEPAKQQADEYVPKQKADELPAKQKVVEQLVKGQADIEKEERKGLKAQRRSNALNAHTVEVAAQQAKPKFKIYYAIAGVIGAGALWYIQMPLAFIATGAIIAGYVGKKTWDKAKQFYKEYKYSDTMRYHLKKLNLSTQVNNLRYDQGYSLATSKFGKVLNDMLAKSEDSKFEANGSFSANQPAYTQHDILLWQKQALEQVAAVNGSRKEIKQQLLDQAKQKFMP